MKKEESLREKYMGEMIISQTSAGLIAIALCSILPAIETRADVFAFFIFFWFVGTVIIWNGLEIKDKLKETGRSGKDVWERIVARRRAA